MPKAIHQRTEKDWEAIGDAYTLANAKIIRGDTNRLKEAKKWAKILAEEEKAESDAMKDIAAE